MGSSNENSAYGDVRNPWDTDRVPGGSSGGSAAAVAAGLAPCAIGTDTGGSIRQPAALCGVVGLKPTYGAISRSGMIAFASSLDQCGPFTRDVTDSALLLRAMIGRDPRDSTSTGIEGGVEMPSREDLKGLRIGVPKELSTDAEGIEPGVREVFERTLALCEELGAERGRGRAAACRLRDLRLLRPRARRGLGEPGALRRRPLRVARAGRRARPDVRADPLGRLRPRGQAPDHARHLRALLRLLRRLLRARPARADADRPRLRRGLRELRPAAHPDLAVGRLPARRARRRPAGDVHVGLLHRADVAGRDPGDLDPGRPRRAGGRRPGAAGRPADRRAGLQRVADPRRRARDRGRRRLRLLRRPGREVPRERRAGVRAGHRPRDPRPAADQDEDVLRLRARVRRRAEHPHLPGLPRPPRGAAGDQRAGDRASR